MSKRGENIYKRKDGRWEGRIRKNSTGKGKYYSFYGKTYKEVKEKMKEEIQKNRQSPKECTVSIEAAANTWISERKEDWKQSTYGIYRQSLDKYILPGFKGMSVCQIDDQTVETFFTSVRKNGGKLSNTYLSYLYGLLKRVIQYSGKREGKKLYIPANPIIKAKRKKNMAPDKSSLAQLERYLLLNTGDDASLGVLITLHTGLRIGELCALTWKDIDLDTGTIHIRQNLQRIKNFESQKNKTNLVVSTPKSAESVRDIPMPPILLTLLKPRSQEDTKPVIAGPKGGWMDPRTLQYRFKAILKKSGVEYFNFHMLRHAFATRCIELGFDTKSLSELLGHSHVQITLSLYVHSSMQQKRQLMDTVAAYTDAGNVF